MSMWLIIFIVSGSAIVLFIAFKILQEKMSILLFWPELRHPIEVALVHRQKKIQTSLLKFSSKNIYIFLHIIVSYLKSVLVRLHQWLDRRSHRLVSLIKGKQTIENRGKASYFLHDVGSYKDGFRKR